MRDTETAAGIIPDGRANDNPTFTLYWMQSLTSGKEIAERGIPVSSAMRALAEAQADAIGVTGSVYCLIAENPPGYGAFLIDLERARQVNDEGYWPKHDARWAADELLRAAVAYCHVSSQFSADHSTGSELWPFDVEAFKPSTDSIRNLVKAGALIAAEIDRRLMAGGDEA